MPKRNITDCIKELVEQEFDIVDDFVRERIAPMAAVGSPYKVIGKPYAEWTRLDLQRAISIYGQNSPVLNQYIGMEQIRQMRALEEAARS